VLFFASGEEKSFITLTPGLPGSEGSHGTPARFPPIGHPEAGSFLVGRKTIIFQKRLMIMSPEVDQPSRIFISHKYLQRM